MLQQSDFCCLSACWCCQAVNTAWVVIFSLVHAASRKFCADIRLLHLFLQANVSSKYSTLQNDHAQSPHTLCTPFFPLLAFMSAYSRVWYTPLRSVRPIYDHAPNIVSVLLCLHDSHPVKVPIFFHLPYVLVFCFLVQNTRLSFNGSAK